MILSREGPNHAIVSGATKWLDSRLWSGAAITVVETNTDWEHGYLQHAGSTSDARCASISNVSTFQYVLLID